MIKTVKLLRDLVGQFDSFNSVIYLTDPIFSRPDKILGGVGELILAHEWTHYFQYIVTTSGLHFSQFLRELFHFERDAIKLLLKEQLDLDQLQLPLFHENRESIDQLLGSLQIILSALEERNKLLYSNWKPEIQKILIFEDEIKSRIIKGDFLIQLNDITGEAGIFINNKQFIFPITLVQVLEFMAFAVEYKLSLQLDLTNEETENYLFPFSIRGFDYNAPLLYLQQGLYPKELQGDPLKILLYDARYGEQRIREMLDIIIFSAFIALMITWHPASIWKTRGDPPGTNFVYIFINTIKNHHQFSESKKSGSKLLEFADQLTLDLGLPIFSLCIKDAINYLEIEGNLLDLASEKAKLWWNTRKERELRLKACKMLLDDGSVLIDPLKWRDVLAEPLYVFQTSMELKEIKIGDPNPTEDMDIYNRWAISHIFRKMLYGTDIACHNTIANGINMHECDDFVACKARMQQFNKRIGLKQYLQQCTNNDWKELVISVIENSRT